MKLFGGRDGSQKEPFARDHPYLSGETVTPGGFACLACGHQHDVPQGTVKSLPVCPRCQGEEWRIA
jgi:hypothetical protein